jgi:hypothetical protein
MYDRNAYNYRSMIHTGRLQLYAMYPTKLVETDEEPKYHVTQIRAFDLTNSPDAYREGIKA